MSSVSSTEVSFARRYVDSLVTQHETDVAFNAPHVVFVLHLPNDEMAFAPIYRSSCFDWQTVFIDNWGMDTINSTTDISLNTPKDLAPTKCEVETEINKHIDPRPWLSMLFGISDPTATKKAHETFRANVHDLLAEALHRCQFPRSKHAPMVPLKYSEKVYKSLSKDENASTVSSWVYQELVKRPYVFNALVNAFSIIWDEQVLRIGEQLRSKPIHGSLVRTVMNNAEWLLKDFLGLFVAKHLSINWGLEAILMLPVSDEVELNEKRKKGEEADTINTVIDEENEPMVVGEDGGDETTVFQVEDEILVVEEVEDVDVEDKATGPTASTSLSSKHVTVSTRFPGLEMTTNEEHLFAVKTLLSSVLMAESISYRERLATSASTGGIVLWSVTCNLPVAAHTPLFTSLLDQMRHFREVVFAKVGSLVQSDFTQNGIVISRMVKECIEWNSLSQSDHKGKHLHKAMVAIATSKTLQDNFFIDFIRIGLQHYGSSEVEVRVYKEAIRTVLMKLVDDGAKTLNVDDEDEDDY
mmetsp:Transcript_21989/g.28675  ORF Transcript_21989/g.28675 Transcript_21989/m.28675 type:complete len:526 (-) Transcript_21989:308-1885(-)